MLSKNHIKYIKSLHNKKERNENKAFLVEWAKSLIELLNSDFEIETLIASEDFYVKNRNLLAKYRFEILKSDEITKLSTLSTNTDGIAIVKQKENSPLYFASIRGDSGGSENEIILILDEIKDPGNLGTIIRIADWYGITKIIASNNTCELYNPKVIISTMWSFTRINMYYTDLEKYFKWVNFPIYGAFMDWENVHKTRFEKSWFLVIGNESNGISKEVEKFVTKKITIPRFGQAESLNAAVATAVILDNMKRN